LECQEGRGCSKKAPCPERELKKNEDWGEQALAEEWGHGKEGRGTSEGAGGGGENHEKNPQSGKKRLKEVLPETEKKSRKALVSGKKKGV